MGGTNESLIVALMQDAASVLGECMFENTDICPQITSVFLSMCLNADTCFCVASVAC